MRTKGGSLPIHIGPLWIATLWLSESEQAPEMRQDRRARAIPVRLAYQRWQAQQWHAMGMRPTGATYLLHGGRTIGRHYPTRLRAVLGWLLHRWQW